MSFSKNKYKELLIKTMLEFIKVCNQNGIEYVGAYGTVLGAIRHKGLIPWDDDIDVFMTRENYEKFLRLKQTLVGSGYEIIDLDDKGYYLPFAKFCNANTTVWEVEDFPFVMGVFIDVFPLDYATKLDKISERLKKNYKTKFEKYMWVQRDDSLSEIRLQKFPKQYFKTLIKKIVKTFCRKTGIIKKSLKDIEKEIKNVKGDFRMYYRSLDSFERSMFPAKWFDDCVELPFENLLIRVPKDYDAFLTKCYGDYMIPPPPEKQNSQHFHYFVDLSRRLSIEEIKRIVKNDK